ncbi:MAG: signal peptidase II, partial [Bizionia sp.]|nr:signal peptidase II [Bizionia sp.]
MTLKKASFFIILILLIDQISKVYIKTHFQLGESVAVLEKFKIYFIENDGMAWGTKLSDIFPFLSDRVAKLSLTLFRVIAIFGIGYWLISTIKKAGSRVLIIALVFIFSGAL